MLTPHFAPFPELKTARLILRRIRNSDAPAILAMRSDEQVMNYIDKEPMKDISESIALIQLINDAVDNNSGINWAIAFSDDPDTQIGTIGFWRIIPQHYRAELGYMLQKEHWKKGIMHEAIQAVIAYGFGALKLHSIEAHINPGNQASAGILEKSGFTREAYFREDFYFRGTFRDTAIYSLLAP